MQSQVTQRNPIVVFLLSFITCGIYGWYWLVKVKGELNRSQNSVSIPTAWVWVIPFVGTIWYEWKFSEATDIVTNGQYSTPVTFMLLFLLGPIGYAILQDGYNKSGNIATTPAAPATTATPVMPAAPTTPTAPFTTVAPADTVAPTTSTVPTTSVASTSSTNPFETAAPASSTNPFETATPVTPATPTTPANPFTPVNNGASQNVDDTNFFNK